MGERRLQGVVTTVTVLSVYAIPFMIFLLDITTVAIYAIIVFNVIIYMQLGTKYWAQKRASGVEYIDAVVIGAGLRPMYMDLPIKRFVEIRPDKKAGVEQLDIFVRMKKDVESIDADIEPVAIPESPDEEDDDEPTTQPGTDVNPNAFGDEEKPKRRGRSRR